MNNLILVYFSGCALFAIIFWEQNFNQPLFERSLTYIPKIQEGASDFKQTMWDLYSNLALTTVNFLPIAVPYLFID